MRTTYDFAPLWRSTVGFNRLDLVDAAQQSVTMTTTRLCSSEDAKAAA
jgi:molecular chaperone IbpA